MTFEEALRLAANDPLILAKLLWPNITFYNKQIETIRSVWENLETYVPAGNKLGKDYVAGFIAVCFFLTRHPCRIVTTSAKDDHLRVLWGEIGQFIQTCAIPLDVRQGGPLILKHREINKVYNGEVCPLSYCKGMVASPDSIASMQGHHIANVGDGIPRTLFISDESSSVPDDYYRLSKTWFDRALIFGNTWPCSNFFFRGVNGGDVKAKDNGHYYRKVIRIKAEDSPNVRYSMAEIRAGRKPSNKMLVPGVKTYSEYIQNRELWNEADQCVSLDAEFWEGASVRLFPPEWLNYAETVATSLSGRGRQAKAIGIDPAEGGDSTVIVVIDEYGVIDLVSEKTPNTNVIVGKIIATMNKWHVPPEKVCIDRGGGGKQHADRLEALGYSVRTVGFGEGVSLDPKRGLHQISTRIDVKEERYAYKNRRAEMYGMLRELLDPSNTRDNGKIKGFGIPAKYTELRRQLAPLPLYWDEEGRMYLPPKQRKTGEDQIQGKKTVTINSLLGCSPDEADALVLAVFAMISRKAIVRAGAMV
jgi:hypothetical protein